MGVAHTKLLVIFTCVEVNYGNHKLQKNIKLLQVQQQQHNKPELEAVKAIEANALAIQNSTIS